MVHVTYVWMVVGCKSLINAVTGGILQPYMKLSLGDATEGEKVGNTNVSNSLPNCFNDLKELVRNGSEFEETEKLDAYLLFVIHLPKKKSIYHQILILKAATRKMIYIRKVDILHTFGASLHLG
ncbi:uncharacterized protein LOC120012397 [Tripterygium wilfordii]|uniref:uncharacterized protein LOC120012397 n=1 Tax=Tripterygium wilfordii TaxID=458696 RepID=UPI0018F807AC|nr:uncharacterized protein LOC120012397 [Tripterygium wilfordii]